MNAVRSVFSGAGLAFMVALAGAVDAAAQPPPSGTTPSPPAASINARIAAETTDETVTVIFFNRPIASLRARILERGPRERAEAAQRRLDDFVAQRITGPVDSQNLDGGSLITVASRGVLVLTALDLDTPLGETLPEATAQTVVRLRQALAAAVSGRTPGMVLRSGALAALGLSVALLALWGIARLRHALSRKIVSIAERTIAQTGIADLAVVRASRLLDIQRQLLGAVLVVADLIVIYAAVTFILRRFPYTSPWGDSMRGFLVASVERLGLGILGAMPGLFTVLLIVVLARFIVRLITLYFNAVERERVKVRWLHPETAQPTRRILTGLLWLFAIVMAYPYLPGSQTDAFKGVSVFLGLMITFGSSGLVNQIMSGFMITYSRALRMGDFVRIGDVEGTVIHLGVLSTKVKTPFSEEITLPNAVIVSQTTTDYSRFATSEGVFTPTSVTIGYDAPWRQVQSLLLLAAERTSGLRAEPKPMVLQAGLEDFYVRYTLLVCLERQESRPFTLHALHAHIQDLFNEHGVQIMSPNYVLDPAAPKLVDKKDWYAAPAKPDPAPTLRSAQLST